MSNMDPVSDLLARIRNAHLAKHDRVDVPTSRLKAEICRILKEEGFIRNFRLLDGAPVQVLRIFLEYDDAGSPAITHLQRISKPGRRVYRGADGRFTLYDDDGISQEYLSGRGTWTRMTWNDAAQQLTMEPAPPRGATNVVAERRFKVVLMPEGTTRDVVYSGKQLRVSF